MMITYWQEVSSGEFKPGSISLAAIVTTKIGHQNGALFSSFTAYMQWRIRTKKATGTMFTSRPKHTGRGAFNATVWA